MTVVGLQPISLKNATLRIAEDDYSQSVDQVLFVPQVEWEWIHTYNGRHIPIFNQAYWTVTIGYAQDFTTPGSLSLYLIQQAAATRTVVFDPAPGSGGARVTADVMIVPGQLGGVPGQHLAATVTMPLYDEPIVQGQQTNAPGYRPGWA